jgi:Tol biopolymer transport system component
LPDRLDAIIAKALVKDRAARYQTATEIHRDLEELKRALDSGRNPLARVHDESAGSHPVAIQKRLAAAFAAGIAVLALLIYFVLKPMTQPHVSGYQQITHDGFMKDGAHTSGNGTNPAMVTDGSRVYFTKGSAPLVNLAQVSAAGGETGVIPTSIGDTQLLDISPDHSSLLVAGFNEAAATAPLWSVPVPAGTPHPLADLSALDATWSPDGREMALLQGEDLYRARSDGSETRKLVHLPGMGWRPRWSPDGKRLRLTIVDPKTGFPSLWELSADGTGLQPLLPGWNTPAAECCGNWTPDGKYYVFESTHNGKEDVWAIRDKHSLWDFLDRSQSKPFALTSGQLSSRSPVLSPDGKKLFVIGQQRRGEAEQWDPKAEKWVQILGGLSAQMVNYSPDGEWVSYVSFPEGAVWRSRPDGSEPLQLTFAPLEVLTPFWSADSKYIAFAGIIPGTQSKSYKIAASGGLPQAITDNDYPEISPDWSPDGQSVVFSYSPFVELSRQPLGVYTFNLTTHEKKKLPGSDELFSGFWSPDGRYIAANSLTSGTVMLFDFKTNKWTALDTGISVMQWSRDSKYLYHLSRGKDPAVVRVRMSDLKVEPVASLSGVRQTGFLAGVAFGLTPDGCPIILRDNGTEEIYSLDWLTD